jgi:sulfatase maturation enzyme AslB (radical SAM superfamily)
VVSIDGLQPEHDERRKPATYDRILKHIVGHKITVHCTVTRQQVRRPGYLEEFVRFWSDNPQTEHIWVSLYTPQVDELSTERLTRDDRANVVSTLFDLRKRYSKLWMPEGLLKVYANPPSTPDECVFAQTTECISADFETRITPCQFGGKPDCEQCGCIASAGLEAVRRHRMGGYVPIGAIFTASLSVGRNVRALRERLTPGDGAPPRDPAHSEGAV